MKLTKKLVLESSIIFLLVLVYGIIRLNTASEQKDIIFDENYYVPMAQTAYTTGVDIHPQYQPPIGRLGVEAGIAIGGDNPTGWRFFSVIAGCIGLLAFYTICRVLKFRILPSLISTIAMSLCSLWWWFSGHACLDIYMVCLEILAMMGYLLGKPLRAGVVSGLAVATKIMGGLTTWTLIILEVWTNRGKRVLEITMCAIVSFFAAIEIGEFLIAHHWVNPIKYVSDLMNYATVIDNYNKMQGAILWFLKYKVELFTDGATTGFWYPMWIITVPLITYAVYKAFKGNYAGKVITSWFAGFYLSWCVLSFVINRGSYVYYELMVLPCLYLALAFALNSLWLQLPTHKKPFKAEGSPL